MIQTAFSIILDNNLMIYKWIYLLSRVYIFEYEIGPKKNVVDNMTCYNIYNYSCSL